MLLPVIKTIVRHYPSVLPHLNDNARRALKAANLAPVKKKYHDAITESLVDYFEGGGNVTAPRSKFKQAATEAFSSAFEAGWVDGGGELPFDGDALTWFNERLQEEFTHIDSAFQDAKELRKQKDYDWFVWATARADGYTNTLDSIYNAALMLVNDGQMLTWHYGDTKHCATCKNLNGKSHRAAWYLERDYIPGKPGAAMDCGGYNCQCWLTDKKGETITI